MSLVRDVVCDGVKVGKVTMSLGGRSEGFELHDGVGPQLIIENYPEPAMTLAERVAESEKFIYGRSLEGMTMTEWKG